MTLYGLGVRCSSVAAACAWENHLRRTDPEEPEPVVARHRAILPGSHPSCRGGVEAYWVTASVHALVRVVVDTHGNVVGVCLGDVACEVCVAPVHGGPDVHPYQTTQALAPFRSRVLGRNTSQTPCLP